MTKLRAFKSVHFLRNVLKNPKKQHIDCLLTQVIRNVGKARVVYSGSSTDVTADTRHPRWNLFRCSHCCSGFFRGRASLKIHRTYFCNEGKRIYPYSECKTCGQRLLPKYSRSNPVIVEKKDPECISLHIPMKKVVTVGVDSSIAGCSLTIPEISDSRICMGSTLHGSKNFKSNALDVSVNTTLVVSVSNISIVDQLEDESQPVPMDQTELL